MNQSTGLERFELLSRIEGKDPFHMEPLKVDRLGTLQDPIKVWSLVSL
jgi:cytochrome c oxidase subunit 5b